MHYQDDSHDNYKVGFFGQTGTGKTTLALEKILSEKHDFIVIIDPDRQWARRLSRPGAPAVCYDTKEGLIRGLAHSGKVCFSPMELFRGNLVKGFDWICEFMWDFSGNIPGNKLLVMDDFPDAMPTSNEKFMEHRICEMTGNGRRRGLDFYALARYYNEGCPKFTGALSELYAFAQPDADCAMRIARQGFDAKEVQTLAPGEFRHLNRQTGIVTSGKVALPGKGKRK